MNPKSVSMGHRLAQCYEKVGNLSQAKTVYENLMRLGKIPPEVYYNYALLCMKTNDKDKAENIFKKVIQLDANNALAHKDLGVVYLSQRLFDYAKDEFEKAYELAPENAQIIFELANFYYATHDYEKAMEYYEKAHAISPDDVDINLFRAMTLMATNKQNEALKILLECRKKVPADHIVLYNIGLIYLNQGNFEAAREFLSDSYSLFQTPETMNALAIAFFELKEYENAKNLASKLLEQFPDNVNVLLLLAKSYIELGDAQNSVQYLEKIMKIFPDQPEAKSLYERIKGVNECTN